LFRQAWLWSAYWRLYPLWHLLRQAVRRRRPVAAWRSIEVPWLRKTLVGVIRSVGGGDVSGAVLAQ